MLDWLLMAEGIDGEWIGGRALTLPTETRYCFTVVPSGGEVGLIPLCKTLRSEGILRPVPEIGGISTNNQ